ncbi:MAG: hemerythrin domain-containing protein [Candidatus Dormibacteraeota bacterium]|uniref:Hemerythrin domain-containing protein n=1 Tax=Candidatus Aeolococcus gillhamiae TaxID=3127015 RepID=A0A934JYT8_9BACT|nr:hemerythrin domain-containing protein [Candidatus Dormibacteraeota bacterium]
MTARSRPPAHPGTVQGLLAREHAEVRHHLDHLRAIADAAPSEEPLMLRNKLDAVLSFLHNGLLPHMDVEEQTLYAAVDRLAEGPHSGPAMVLDHEAIRALVADVDRATGGLQSKEEGAELQRLLFVLEAVARLHVDKEERLYRPALKRLPSKVRAEIGAQLRAHAVTHGHESWGFSDHPRP